MLASTLDINEQSVTIHRVISEPSGFGSLESYLQSFESSHYTKIFFLVIDKNEKILCDKVTAKNVIFVSKSRFSIFPNFTFSDYYVNLKLDLHNSRNFISYDKAMSNSELAQGLNHGFIYGRIDRNNLAILNKDKSYCLKFLNSLSELDLPLVENVFAVIKSLKNDFAYYFE